MPKTRTRKRRAAGAVRRESTSAAQLGMPLTDPSKSVRPLQRGQGFQGLITPAMVALGCWGMAVSFIFFYASDPNHLLYGGFAAVMGLMWSFSFGTRLRKVLQQHRRLSNG